MPPLSLIPGKFAAGVVDTSGNFLPPVSLSPVENLPPLSLILVVHLLREFLKKFEMVLLGYSEAGAKLIHEKKPEAKNLVTLSL